MSGISLAAPVTQLHLSHQSLHRLVIDDLASVPQRCRNAPVAIAALVPIEHRADLLLELDTPLARCQQLELVVKRTACQSGGLQQCRYGMVLPEFAHYLRFFLSAARFFASSSASNFFR